jgi:hypothetical protein
VIAYVDSSILLRIVLELDDPLPEWNDIERGVTSAISEVECLRVLDRLRLEAELTDESVSEARADMLLVLDSFETVQVTEAIVARAAQPMPIILGPLNAIHLATALLWREVLREEPVVATHHRELALGARAFGFQVVGA